MINSHSITYLVDKENEIEILQEKITSLTLPECERDEKISQIESELRDKIKMQSTMSKARTFVMKQFRSVFKQKKGKLNLYYKRDFIIMSST